MRLAKILIVVAIIYIVGKYFIFNTMEGYSNIGNEYTELRTGGCDVNIAPLGAPENHNEPNLAALSMCGWNNSVSTDTLDGESNNWAPESLKGTDRVFKYPNYYGYGTGEWFHYGEPYYVRNVNY